MKQKALRTAVLAALLPAFVAGCTASTAAPFAPDATARAAVPQSAGRLSALPDFSQLAEQAGPAVVNISVTKVATAAEMPSLPFDQNDPFSQFFRRFQVPVPKQAPMHGIGSGFIVSGDGYILTNAHVVNGTSEVNVKLTDRREFTAKVVGTDPKSDIALLKIDATGLPTLPFGDSDKLQVGEPVMAIGNPFGLERTVTTGIVSATGRVIGQGPYDDFIQTDASINPGNSGGPLINARGQAVGINAAIFSQNGGSVGIGFAIPVNQAKSVVTQLAATGKVTRGWLGVMIQPLTPELAKGFNVPGGGGALVASVQDNSPAARAGVKAGDVITEYDGHKLAQPGDLSKLVAATAVGRQVPLTIVREGKTMTLEAHVARMEEPDQAAVARNDEGKEPLGLSVETITPSVSRELGLADARGVVVRGVRDSSPAEKAGIRPGDVITELDHQPVANAADLKRLLAKHAKGAPVVVLLHRDGNSLYAAMTS